MSKATTTRTDLERGGTMHALHWCVVGLSLVLTIGASWITRSQHEEKIEASFNREAERVTELIHERMQKYDDALWGGVATLRAKQNGITHQEWQKYSESLNLDTKYPGINGIGIIQEVSRSDAPSFIAQERTSRTVFRIHPEHENDVLYPIVLVEPIAANKKAVGLDVAFEINRRSALEKARDTGISQVTGPIVLVQDSEKTPGFLYYAPYYKGGPYDSIEERRQNFVGAVYAPFIMSKLMEGTLRRDTRHLTLQVRDKEQVLYDEHTSEVSNYDASPMFKSIAKLNMRGRVWTVDMRTDDEFRTAATSNQSTIILVGGISIDILLLMLFLFLSRSNRRALSYADEVTLDLKELNVQLTLQQEDLEKNRKVLERSNAELEQFAFVAAHDLQEPLRMVRSYSELLKEDLGTSLNEEQSEDFGYLMEGASRMQSMVADLLAYSRVENKQRPFAPKSVSLRSVLTDVLHDLDSRIQDSSAEIVLQNVDIQVLGDPNQLHQVFQNLLSNAIKFQRPDTAIHISVLVEKESSEVWRVSVRDNGVGISKDMQERIFQIFQRLHTRGEFEGTGLGLAIVKKIVERHRGTISVESTPGVGSSFSFTLPSLDTQILKSETELVTLPKLPLMTQSCT